MIFDFLIAIDLWLVALLPVRLFWPCWSFVPWTLWGTCMCFSLGITIMIHVYQWQCWKYLRHRPQRLRSLSDLSEDDHVRTSPKSHIFGWWFFFVCVSYIVGAILRSECNISWWPGTIALGMLALHTSAVYMSNGISSSESLSSNVNDSAVSSNVNDSAVSSDTASAMPPVGDASKSSTSELGESSDREASCTASSSSSTLS